jgi:hypothetical protein
MSEFSCNRIYVFDKDARIAMCGSSSCNRESNQNEKELASDYIYFSIFKDRYTSYYKNLKISYSNTNDVITNVDILASNGSVKIPESEIKKTNAKISIYDPSVFDIPLLEFSITNIQGLREIKIYLESSSQVATVSITGHLFNRNQDPLVYLSINGGDDINIANKNGFFSKKGIIKSNNLKLNFPNSVIMSIASINNDVDLDVVLDSDGGILPIRK